MWLWVVTGLLVILFNLISPKKWHWPSFERALWKIPGPVHLPYVGNAVILIGIENYDFLPTLIKLANQYKPIFYINLLGFYKVILTDCHDIEKILSNRTNITKSDDYNILSPWLGTGLLTSAGEKWFSSRRMLTPAFHYGIVDEYIEIFGRNSRTLIRNISEGGPIVEINPLICLCTLDIICETAMGTQVNAQKGGQTDYVSAVLEMSKLFQIRQLNPLLYRPWVFNLSLTGRRQRKVLNTLHSFTEKVIEERRKQYREHKDTPFSEETKVFGAKQRKSFLDVLIEHDDEKSMTSEEIRNEVDTFMFEGHDTTAAAIFWALYELGLNRDIQKLCQLELDEIFADDPDRLCQPSDVLKMKYLERVVKETLRLYPSVPIIARQMDNDINIRGYNIPQGAGVGLFIFYLHRDPTLYPEPEKFDPDRFLPEVVAKRHPFSYIPFSAGPRNCIGQRFAMAEDKVVLAEILRKFDVESLDKKEDVKFLMELILRPSKNLRMKFTPRTK